MEVYVITKTEHNSDGLKTIDYSNKFISVFEDYEKVKEKIIELYEMNEKQENMHRVESEVFMYSDNKSVLKFSNDVTHIISYSILIYDTNAMNEKTSSTLLKDYNFDQYKEILHMFDDDNEGSIKTKSLDKSIILKKIIGQTEIIIAASFNVRDIKEIISEECFGLKNKQLTIPKCTNIPGAIMGFDYDIDGTDDVNYALFVSSDGRLRHLIPLNEYDEELYNQVIEFVKLLRGKL